MPIPHALAAAAAIATVVAPTAFSAQNFHAKAPLKVPHNGVLKASSTAHVEFPLPTSFKPAFGQLEGNRAQGVYERVVKLASGSECRLRLSAGGKAQAKQPAVRNGSANMGGGITFRVKSSGRSGNARWYAGRYQSTIDAALAVMPAAKGLAPAADRYVSIGMTLEHETGAKSDEAACAAAQRRAAPVLRNAISRARVVRSHA